MTCIKCGNCEAETNVFYCPARNEFVIKEDVVVRERVTQWKKGDPGYEYHRRRLRKEKEDLKTS